MHKKLLLLIGIFLLSIQTSKTFADLGGFDIRAYDVNIQVYADGEIEIKEQIQVMFHEERHGIYRTIPYIYEKIHTHIYDIKTNTMFDRYKEGKNIQIKIGDPNKKISWLHTYIIEYKVYGSIRQFEEHQEFYRNIIGTQRNTNITNITFTITFPESINIQKDDWFAYYGQLWSKNKVKNISRDNNNQIKGSILHLNLYEAITIGVKLPKSYTQINKDKETARKAFVLSTGEKLIKSNIFYLSFLIPLLVFLYVNKKREQHGKEEKLPTVTTYEPPKELTPGETGMIELGRTTHRHIFANIYNRATQWSVLFNLIQKKVLFMKLDSLTIEKQKDSPSNNNNFDTSIRNTLFPGTEKTFILQQKNQTFTNKIKNIIQEQNQRIKKTLYTPETISLSKKFYIYGFVTILISFIGIGITQSAANNRALLFPALIMTTVIWIIWAHKILKRTKKWKQLQEEAKWFKEFMKMVEEPRLQQFIKQDPKYFDKTLPYAIAFWLQTQRTKKFENILINYNPTRITWAALTSTQSSLSTIQSSITTFGSSSAFAPSWGSWWSGWGWGSGGGWGGWGGWSW